MALTGLDIFKHLPKTNCGDCGVPTCLAFAMKLAQKKAELSECPHASEEATSVLGAASEPPMRLLKVGGGSGAFEIGGETEMYRHEKTFCHQTSFAIQIEDTEDSESIAHAVKEADGYVIERIGESLHIDAFYLDNVSRDKAQFLSALETITAHSSKPIILGCSDSDTLGDALTMCEGKRPIVYPGDADSAQYLDLVKGSNASLIVTAESFDGLCAKAEQIAYSGYKELLLNLKPSSLRERFENNTILRRAALRRGFKPFGYPLVWFADAAEPHELLADAVIGTCKYTGIMVLPRFSKEMMLTVFVLRQNIYTDPQKPIQVDPKLYAVGEPRSDSPVFVTTNFSLTYFIVSGEIENAGISAWLVVPDCEGMSVLTAWAAGKFSGETIAKFIKDIKVEEHVTTRTITIPGFVASISGELEENLPGWTIIVGPQEASDLAPFVKNVLQL